MTAARLVTEAPLAHLRWEGAPGAACAVLLHGVGGSRESFGDRISGTGAALALAGFAVVAVDLPGYGDTLPQEPTTMASMATALGRLLQALPDPRFVLVGHSMGGMVVQEFMATAVPALRSGVVALALIGTSAAFGKPDGTWQREFLAQRLAPLDAGGSMTKLAPGLVMGMASPKAPHDAVARAAVLMSAVPEATYRAALAAIAGFDRREALADLRVPVLCLAGADDRNAPPSVMSHMAQCIPGAEYVCVPHVGHLLHMEAPEAVNAVLIEFLRRTL
jgi:3-oxoadipate enol-lactonase